jgi:hypothetical protein
MAEEFAVDLERGLCWEKPTALVCGQFHLKIL